MAISFVGSTTGAAANGGNPALAMGNISGLAEGDLVIVAFAEPEAFDVTSQFDDLTHTFGDPFGGWTFLGHMYANSTTDINLAVWAKFMGPTLDASVTPVGQGTLTSGNSSIAMAFRGVDRTRPLDVLPTTATGNTSGIPDPPSITPSGRSGVWTVIVGATGSVDGFSATYTFPTGYTTNGATSAGNDTNDATVGMGYNSSPGSPENPGVMTPSFADSATYSWAAMTLALRPAETQGIYLVGSASSRASNGGDVTITLPTCLENDLVVVVAAIPTGSDIDVAMTTSGYTEVADLFATDTAPVNTGVFYKKMGSTPDTTAVVAGGANGSDGNSAVAMVFRNVDPATPMDVTATTATGSNSGNANPASIDYLDPNALIVVAAGLGHAFGASAGYVYPTNYFGVSEYGDDTRDSLATLAYKGSHLASDPEDPPAFFEEDLGGAAETTHSWCAVTIALRSASVRISTVFGNRWRS